MAYNQYKVLEAFQRNNIRDMHFSWNTGYGYDDPGRDAVERVYADIFHTEAALVRPTIVNGTHALTLTLMGILRPGDEMIYCTGGPYDTLEEVIGLRGEGKGSLKEYGISYKQVELTPEGNIDYDALQRAIGPATRMVCLQRATGYAWRKAISIEEIRECTAFVKNIDPNIICMADNCYGEFLHIQEPTDAGIDVMAGSLIKNPGGGLALTGGYIAGRQDLIDKVSYRMTSPGIGGECGLTFGQTRSILQGLFIAPKTVNGALKGAVLCGKAFELLGYDVCPGPEDLRSISYRLSSWAVRKQWSHSARASRQLHRWIHRSLHCRGICLDMKTRSSWRQELLCRDLLLNFLQTDRSGSRISCTSRVV